MNIKGYLPKSLLCILLLTFGCDESQPKQQTPQTVDQPAGTTSSYYINSTDNNVLAEIIDAGNEVTLRAADLDFFGEIKGDKRKYYDQNNKFRYAVKFKERTSFKLRDENEELLWKVKLMEGKVKIASNEEMNDAYQISISDGKKIKIKKSDEEISALRFIPGDQNITVNDKYMTVNLSGSHALGVLMIDAIPEIEKYLICAELLKLKR